MNKQQKISALRHINPLRSKADWNKSSAKEIDALYKEGIALGVIKKPSSTNQVSDWTQKEYEQFNDKMVAEDNALQALFEQNCEVC